MSGSSSKLKETQDEDKSYLKKLKLRLDHLNELYTIKSTEEETYERWTSVRLQRLLVDYVLRLGYHETAEHLIQAAQLKVRGMHGMWLIGVGPHGRGRVLYGEENRGITP